MANGSVEVWFLSEDELAVSVVTDLEAQPGAAREVLETAGFAALAAGVLANLSKEPARTLAARLAEVALPPSSEDIPASVDGWLLVLPPEIRGNSRGFEGTFRLNGPLPVSRWKPRGFRLFSKDVQFYSGTAIEALFWHLLAGFTSQGRLMLVETARTLADLHQAGATGMTSHPRAAAAALDRGVETAEPI